MDNEMCQIRVMFPAESDEQAIEVKKRISELLKDNKEAQIHFALTPSPAK